MWFISNYQILFKSKLHKIHHHFDKREDQDGSEASVLVFYRETKAGEKGEGFSAKLWSIDITGYNERRLSTKTDASDPSWSSLLSK